MDNNNIKATTYISPSLNTSLPPALLDNKSSPLLINMVKRENTLLSKRAGTHAFQGINTKPFIDMRTDKSNVNLTIEASYTAKNGISYYLLSDISNDVTKSLKTLYFGISYGDVSKIAIIDSGLGQIDRNYKALFFKGFQYNDILFVSLNLFSNTRLQQSNENSNGDISCLRQLQLTNGTLYEFIEALKSGVQSFDKLTATFIDHTFTNGTSPALAIPQDFSSLVKVVVGREEPFWFDIVATTGRDITQSVTPSLIVGIEVYNELLFIALYDTKTNKTIIYYSKTELATALENKIQVTGRVTYLENAYSFIILGFKNCLKRISYQSFNQTDGYIFTVENFILTLNNIDPRNITLTADTIYLISEKRAYKIPIKERNMVYTSEKQLESIDNNVSDLFSSFKASGIKYNAEKNNIEISSYCNNNFIATLLFNEITDAHLDSLFEFSYEGLDKSLITKDNFVQYLSKIKCFILSYDITLNEWYINFYPFHIFSIVNLDLYINDLIISDLDALSKFNNFNYQTLNDQQKNVLTNEFKSNLSLGTYNHYRVRSGWFFGDDNLFYPCISSYNPYTKNPLNRAIIKNIEVLYNNWITLLNRSLEQISMYVYILNDSITYFNASDLREIGSSNSALIVHDKVNEMLNINNSKFIISSRVNAYNATIVIAIKSYQLSTILSTVITSEVTR